MPSSLPKYSGLISEHQLSILDEFIALHDGISKARVLGRLLEAWQDAGKPILGDRDTTLLDLALQFEQLDLDALMAQKVREYLDIHLDSLVNNLVENKLRPISNIDNRETPVDYNLVNNELATNDLEDDENLAEGNIADKGESKLLTDKDEGEVLSLPVLDKQLGDKQKEESEVVINKDINQVDNVSEEDISKVEQSKEKDKNKDNTQDNNLTEDDINNGITPVDEVREEDSNKDNNQVKNLNCEDISSELESSEEGHNLVNNKVSNKVSENDEAKQEVKDSFMSTIPEENPASELVITLDKSQVNNQPDVSHIPADFLALSKGKVETKILADTLGLSSSARVTDLASGKKKTLPFPEFWDYLSVKKTPKTDKNGNKVNYYQWTKMK